MHTRILLFLIFSTLSMHVYGQNSPYIHKIIEYHPAPGQFINTNAWGTPNKANSIIGSLSGGISLGGYGGYIIVGFDHTIQNHPDNPYGIDFTIFGNPLTTNGIITWSEAGIVMVMKDENGNGLPDDTWYELAGSDHHFNSTINHYEITYRNPKSPIATDIPWTDNQDRKGHLLANSFHLQPYFPLAENFPQVDQDKITFKGTLIAGNVDRSNPSYIQSYKRGFGYADNIPAKTGDPTIPDNPYTRTIEGAGGDAFDIDWAIDENGNHVSLDGIDFIKIYTGMNADGGWLGEISTEIRGVVAVAPNPAIAGVLDMVVIADVPSKIDLGQEIWLEAYAFHKGIVQPDATFSYTIKDSSTAEITQEGKLTAIGTGTITVTVALENNPAIFDEVVIEVIAPAAIAIFTQTSSLRVGTKTAIKAVVNDDNGNEIIEIPIEWNTSDPGILSILSHDGDFYIEGKAVGNAWLKVQAKNIPQLKDSVMIKVLPKSDRVFAHLTIKGPQGAIIPRTHLAIENFDLNPYVHQRQDNYTMEQLPKITVAHAIAQLFSNEDYTSDLRFKDDLNEGLHLWRVPKGDFSNIEYVYGYGGITTINYDKAWMVKVNQHTYVNNLQNVIINEGDEIVVYWVNKVDEPWEFTQLTSDKDTIAIGESILIRAIRSFHSLGQGGSIKTSISEAVQNAEIFINGNSYKNQGATILTDEVGQAMLSFSNSGIKEIEVAGETIKVMVGNGQVTGIAKEKQNTISVSPNPFQEKLLLNNLPESTVYCQIIDLAGKIWMSSNLKNNATEIDTKTLAPGIYILQIRSSTNDIFFKIVKL